MVKEIYLNENWLVKKGFDCKILEGELDAANFYTASIPHNNTLMEESYFDEVANRCVYTYARVLVLPQEYEGCKLRLKFGGVLNYVEVYVNGTFITSHKGDAPFEADITAPVKFNYENKLVLKVDSTLKKSVPCCGVRGPSIVYGGIHRDVSLLVLDGREISDVYICTPSVSEKECSVEVDVTLFDFYPETELRASVLGSDGSDVVKLSAKTVYGAKVPLKGFAEGVKLWAPDNPAMYTLKTQLFDGEKLLDERLTPFGFVRAKFKRDGFYLNGKLTKLIGLNREDSYPLVGRAMPSCQQIADARILKFELGCNVVRTLGLASKDFISECNKIGLMVIEDIAGDGYIGTGDWRDAVIDSVSAMVARDRSDPSVIAWGVRVNNSLDCNSLYFKTNKAAKDLDPIRATLGARNFMSSHVFEDVFGFNEYSKGRLFSKRGKSARLFFPFIITEHTGRNFPVKRFDNEEMRLEQALRHLSVIDKVVSGGRTSGAIGMCFNDFNAGKQRGSGDNVNYFGVTDLYRNLKTAGYAYASQTDGVDNPVMELSGNLAPDEFGGELYIFTNADSVKLYRDGVPVREYFPTLKRYPGLKHPPIVISDFIGELPKEDNITGFKLKLFKSLIQAVENKGYNWNFVTKVKAFMLKKLLKIDSAQLLKLVDKYSVSPPLGTEYRFDGIYDGEVKITKYPVIGSIKKLCLESNSTQFVSKKSYEVIKFTAKLCDTFGNVLNYEFSPIRIKTEGCIALIGAEDISLKGGIASFYIKNISDGAGTVSVSSVYGNVSVSVTSVFDKQLSCI